MIKKIMHCILMFFTLYPTNNFKVENTTTYTTSIEYRREENE